MNSSQLTAFSARAAATGAALWPATVLIAGEEYAATLPEPAKVLGELIPGAEQTLGSLVARVAVALLAVAPTPQQALKWKRPGESEWNATTWWIDEVSKSPLDAEWRIVCSPKN